MLEDDHGVLEGEADEDEVGELAEGEGGPPLVRQRGNEEDDGVDEVLVDALVRKRARGGGW